jgi:hypothetical protein
MARSSLTYIPGFSVKFFFQLIYTDYESSNGQLKKILFLATAAILNGGQGLSDIILKGTHPGTIPARFDLI